MATLEIRLLARSLDVLRRCAVEWPGTAPALSACSPISCSTATPPWRAQHLAFLFWPDSAETQAWTNLRNLLHTLMQSLPEGERFIRAEAQTVQWRSDAPFSLDVDSFQSAVKQADTAESLQAAVVRLCG